MGVARSAPRWYQPPAPAPPSDLRAPTLHPVSLGRRYGSQRGRRATGVANMPHPPPRDRMAILVLGRAGGPACQHCQHPGGSRLRCAGFTLPRPSSTGPADGTPWAGGAGGGLRRTLAGPQPPASPGTVVLQTGGGPARRATTGGHPPLGGSPPEPPRVQAPTVRDQTPPWPPNPRGLAGPTRNRVRWTPAAVVGMDQFDRTVKIRGRGGPMRRGGAASPCQL